MGRRKIEIEFIREDRSRATTFIKRKSGLFKKAHELAILTGAQVAVVVFSQQDRLFTYSNEPCAQICSKYLSTPSAYEAKGPQDYSTAQDNEDDSDDDAGSQDGPTRKGSLTTQQVASKGSNSNPTIDVPKSVSRKNSVQLSPRIPSPRISTPKQHQTEFGLQASPALSSSGQKRGQSPVGEPRSGSPKFVKHEQVSRDISDVRNSPHQLPRSQSSSRQGIATPPMVQSQDFSMHMSAPMIPPHPSQVYPQLQGPPAGYMPHSHMQQQVRIQGPPQMMLQHGPPSQQAGPHYSNPVYSHATPARQLPMAPPLSIPSNISIQSSIRTSAQAQEQQRNAQPLLPPGIPNSGASRVLLPGEGTGLTPTDSPSNFASNLYPSSNLSGIGTNVTMPRISTDVGSLFYNWNTNEPGLSPATSMQLNQFRENPESSGGPSLEQHGGPPRSQLSGPPISAGVLENFSPTTAQWLSGHGIPPAQTDSGRPY